MSRNCAKHQDCEYIFLNLTEGKSESRLLCEICIQEQSETHSLSLITINTLKTKGLSQYQKFLQFADESSLLPLINFSLAKGDTLESINKFYDDLSTSFLQFVESKREQTQQAFHGLLEAQTKLQTLSRVEELQQILQQSEDVDSETLITKINSFFKSKNESKDEVKSYLESCLTKSSLLESFKQLSSKVDEIKEKVTLVLKMEDDINDLTELSQSEQRRVQLLKDRINSQTKQLQRLISQNQALRLQSNSLTGSSSQPQLSKEVLSLYQIDALNKSKAQNFLQKQIADAINNSKYFTPTEIIKSEDGLIFSRTQPGKPLLGIIDVPLSFENFGKSFKVKILQGYCAVGVCARDINVKRGYRFDNQIYSPQSGYNMVSTSGYTFSSFNSGLHNNYLKLHYYAVSTIEVTPCDNKVLYYHENFTKDFPFEPQEDIVYSPCFMLSENSSIEFIIDE